MVYSIKQSKQVFFGWQSMFIQIPFIKANQVDFIIDYILV